MPIYVNNTEYSHCISDLDITFAPRGNSFSGHIHSIPQKQVDESMGLQMLLSDGTLSEASAELLAQEQQRKKQLHADRKSNRLGIQIENESVEIGGFDHESRAADSLKKTVDGATGTGEELGDVITQ